MFLKKLVALLMAGTISLCMCAGCSSSASKPSETEPSTANHDEKITLTYMTSGTIAENDFETEQLPKLVKKVFPNVTLEVTKLPDDQYYTALKTKLASGEAPDFMGVQPRYAGTNSLIGMAEAGYLEPISELESLKLSSESGRESFTYDGEVYVIPASVTILGAYYNKDMFEQNNLEVPTNWEEFLNVCETLKNAGIQPIVMGDKDMYVMQFGLYQIAANQIYAANAAYDDQLRTEETSFSDADTWDKVLEMYKTLYDKGYMISSSLGLSSQQAIQKYVDGEAAMIFDGSFNASAMKAAGAATFERGCFPLPGNDAGSDIYTAMSMTGSPAIYSGSKNIDLCKKIVNTWFDGESDLWKAWINTGKYNPTYGWGSDQIDPLFTGFMDLYNDGKSFYWCNQGWPAGVETEMETLFSEAVSNQGTTIEDITKGMQNKFNELLEN